MGLSKYVPLRSIWLLQLYASEVYQRGLIRDSAVEDADAELPVLVSSMLCDAVERRMREQLSVAFETKSGNLHRVRGKIDVYHTARHQLLEKGKVRCQYETLSLDGPVNRYLLRALNTAMHKVQAFGDTALTRRCRRLVNVFRHNGVTLVETLGYPGSRLSPRDHTPVAIAKLLLELFVPAGGKASSGNTVEFRNRTYEEAELRKLFEKALYGLYRYHLPTARVTSGRRMSWPDTENSNAAVPEVETDIIIKRPSGEHLIVDAKFTSMATTARQVNRPTLNSGHIYQITSYATAYALNEPAGTPVHGVMVYATLGLPAGHSDFSASDFPDVQEFSIGQHRMRFAALDLTGSARKVREAALAAVK